jgi:L-cystine transport system permease protein
MALSGRKTRKVRCAGGAGVIIKDLFQFRYVWEYFPLILSRLHITLLIVVFATILGFILAIGLALSRLYKIPVLAQFSTVYISFIRGTPVIVQMYLVYYGLPAVLSTIGIDLSEWDAMYFIIATYALNAAAFLSEIIRASITAIPAGQTEAAVSVGMTRLQTFRQIVAPQALVIALPSLATSMVGLLQDTSIAYLIGTLDIMGKITTLGANTYHYLEGYFVAAVIFIAFSIAIEKASNGLGKKFSFGRACV